MKRVLCALLALLMLLGAAALADEPRTMRITNCKEWVSLRAEASTGSERLARVPLGALVTGCREAGDGFIRCTYRETTGYVLSKYLEDVSSFSQLPAKPSLEVFRGFGVSVAEVQAGPGDATRAVVQKISSADVESMCAAVFGADGGFLSKMAVTLPVEGQYRVLDAFSAGTEDEPRLAWFTGSRLNLYRVTPKLTDGLVWSIPYSASGISHDVDVDGTIYVTGYEGGVLTCIAPDGEIRWRSACSDPDIYWPFLVDASQADRVVVTYEENGAHDDTTAAVAFSKEDGTVLSVKGRPPLLVGWAAEDLPDGTITVDLSDPDEVSATVFFDPAEDVENFRLLSISFERFEEGDEVFTAEEFYVHGVLTPEHPLAAAFTFYGDMPEYGYAYTDSAGEDRFFAVDSDGESGAVVVWEIRVQ